MNATPGFDKAQAEYDAQEPEDPCEMVSIDMTFVVRLGLLIDLTDYYDGDSLQATAEAYVRQVIEDNLTLVGYYGGDENTPIDMDDVEFLDIEVEVTGEG